MAPAPPMGSAPSNDAPKENVDLMRERIWRDLAREAAREEKELEEHNNNSTLESASDINNNISSGIVEHHGGNEVSSSSQISGGMAPTSSTQSASSAVAVQHQTSNNQQETNFLGYVGRPYQTSDLLRNLAFGATIGSITGMCFGFMDSIRSAQSSPLLKSASRDAQGKFIFQGTYRSGLFYGGFFGAFHTIKYGIRTVIDPGDIGEIGAASVVTLGGMFAKREWRASLPYAVMLVGMDGFHIFMREEGKA